MSGKRDKKKRKEIRAEVKAEHGQITNGLRKKVNYLTDEANTMYHTAYIYKKLYERLRLKIDFTIALSPVIISFISLVVTAMSILIK